MRIRNFITSAIPPDKTREQIAHAVGISRVHLQRIIAGTQIPSIEIALRLALVLRKTVEELFHLDYADTTDQDASSTTPPGDPEDPPPPRETPTHQGEKDDEGAGGPSPNSETILLVEDEVPLRKLTREFLEGIGYHVLEAAAGAEALRISGQHEAPIHLLVTDVVMPGMNGRELARQIEAQRHGIKVIYVSGYTGDDAVRQAISEQSGSFLQKPFALEALAKKIREILDT